MKRVFVTEYVGLSTRLEALAMAFLISERFGHEVCVDWHELDALNVVGAHRRGRGLLGRIDSVKLHGGSAETWHRLAAHRNVVLRTHEGPRHLLEPLYLPTARRVKLRPDLVGVIRDTFAPYAGRPLVGVHIRRGDFALVDPDRFDVDAAEWPAVPDWWYADVMAKIRARFPTVAFFVACTGSLDDYPSLRDGFDVFDLPTAFPYGYKGPSHEARRHPAADLFALGCCNVLIGSPCSTFSHYAADMLGAPTALLVPPPKMARSAPSFGRLDLHGRGAFDYYAACRTGRDVVPVDDAATLPIGRGAHVDWM